jgi:predicted kinase
MRKWMRDRMQRRKKKPAAETESQPAPPPLQPAYFEAGQTPDDSSPADSPKSQPKNRAASAPEMEEDRGEEVPAAESAPSKQSQPAEADPQRGRRRRRGGRGRGGAGRGREQAVAQAFTPAVAKGIVPEVPVEGAEEPGAESAEPEAQAAVAEPQVSEIPAVVPTAPARPPKGIVVLAIGLPGSGKSTWFKRHSVTALSSDMMRAILFDDVREQRFQDLVFSNLRAMLKARLIAKRPMNYVDATNLTPQERQHWIKLAKDYHYEVQAVFFDVPLEVCVERHQRRDRVVPEDVMRRMAAKLKPPSFEEGFAKITVVRVKKKE